MGIPEAGRRLAGDQGAAGDVDQPGELAVEQGEIEVLPLTGLFRLTQGCQDTGKREHPGQHIGDGYADLIRLADGRSGDRHQAAHGLDDVIVAGVVAIAPGLAEAGDAGIDQRWMILPERVIIEAELRHLPRPEVLDHNVTLASKFTGDVLALRRFQVKDDAALVAIDCQIIGALTVFTFPQPGWTPVPGIVAARGFDLDDLCPKIAEEHGTERTRQHTGKIEDADASQGKRKRFSIDFERHR